MTTSREIVEWSTPDCCASWRCDIFLALSCARSHSLNARPFSVVMTALLGLRGTVRGFMGSVGTAVRRPNPPLVLSAVDRTPQATGH